MNADSEEKIKLDRKSRWYFPGLAGAGGALLTHPMDSMKVIMQVQEERTTMRKMFKKMIQNNTIIDIYKGVVSSMMRQILNSSTRFQIYEIGKPYFYTEYFIGKVCLAGIAGFIGGVVGSPAELLTVRIQYNIALPLQERKNYRHSLDAFIDIYKTEGLRTFYNGTTLAGARGSCITIGQLAFYDQFKQMLAKNFNAEDNLQTHVVASTLTVFLSTAIFHPVDVLKTRTMIIEKHKYTGIFDVFINLCKLGPSVFFKGFIPALLRNAPNTILLFILLEELRIRYGFDPPNSN